MVHVWSSENLVIYKVFLGVIQCTCHKQVIFVQKLQVLFLLLLSSRAPRTMH